MSIKLIAPNYLDFLWNETRIYSQYNNYHFCFDFLLTGALDKKRLHQALQCMTQKYAPFHSCLRQENNTRYLHYQDTALAYQEYRCKKNERNDLIQQFIQRPFDLTQPPLYRFALFSTPTDARLVLVFHHAIIDGTQFEAFLSELSYHYNHASDIDTDKLAWQQAIPKLEALFQRLNQKQDHYHDMANFWQQQLAEVTARIDIAQSEHSHAAVACDSFSLPKTAAYRRCLQQFQLTDFSFGYLAWAFLLSQLSHQSQLLLPYPIAIEEHDLQTGALINTIACPLTIDSAKPFEHLVQQWQDFIIQLKQQAPSPQQLPTSLLVNALKKVDILSAEEPFGNIAIAQTHLRQQGLDLDNVDVIPQRTPNLGSYEVNIELQSDEESCHWQINFQQTCLDQAAITSITNYFQQLVRALIHQPEQILGHLVFIEKTEQQQLLQQMACPEHDYPNEQQHFLEYFSTQVQQHGESLAIFSDNQQLTYRELDTLSDQWAAKLQQQFQQLHQRAIKANDSIVLCSEKHWTMVVAILAIVKAGAAYIPIASITPDQQLAYIIDDAKAGLIITQSHLIEKRPSLAQEQLPVLTVEYLQQQNSRIALQPIHYRADDLAYLIYTSGTTGKPKGVMIAHHSVANLIRFYQHEVGLGAHDRRLQYSSLNFDASVPDILVSLALGAAVYVIDEDTRLSAEKLYQFMAQHHITTALIPPAMLRLLPRKPLVSLRVLESGGEAADPDTMTFWSQQTQFLNLYGPTEATVCATYRYLNSQDSTTWIGRPLPGLRCYVLNPQLQLLPIGAVGELYLSGLGLARGYLNLSKLTQQRFLANPYASPGFEKLYKTGDLVRYRPDGTLEYLGREDSQVKIRGFRIELGAIEAVLLQHEAIRESIVTLYKQDKQKHIIAYYVSDEKLHSADLTKWIAKKLPKYMLPSFYLHLARLPITINGKVDRKALPLPDVTTRLQTYVAPKTALEQQLADIWSELFQIERISICDNFFSLGGQSILAIKLCSMIAQRLQRQCDVKTLFKYPNIQELAQQLPHSDESTQIKTVDRQQLLTLSYAQQRLWFIERYEEKGSHYNIPLVYQFDDDIDCDLLLGSLQAVVTRHEILRTYYQEDGQGNAHQVISDDSLHITQHHISNSALDERLQQLAHYAFDLTKHHPIKVEVLHTQQHHYCVIILHHIAFDGWSVDILTRDWQAYYQHLSTGEPLSLAPLNIQYADFALWQRHFLQGKLLQQQLDFWQQQLHDFEPLNLATDRPRPKQLQYHGANLRFELTPTLSQDLLHFSEQHGCTLYMVGLAAFFLLLQRYSGQDDIIIGSPISNRHYPQIENLIGFFVNTLALRQKIDATLSVADYLEQIKALVLGVHEHQDLPFEQLIEALQPEQDTSRHPLFQVLFNVQNFISNKLAFGESSLRYLNMQDHYPVAKFDLDVELSQGNDNISILFNYNTSLFNASTIKRMAKHYETILASMINSLTQPLQTLSILSAQEYQQVVYQFNTNTHGKPYPRPASIIDLFEQQVTQSPERIALVFEEHQLSYYDLNQKANQLAQQLAKLRPLTQQNLIGVYLERSAEFMIALLAILKLGDVYVPIDPESPNARITHILHDTQLTLLVTQQSLPLPPEMADTLHCVFVEDIPLGETPLANPTRQITEQDLAYVLYTSGSTGKPKGVMIAQRGLINLCYVYQDYFDIDKPSVSSQIASQAFDTFGCEVWPFLTCGAKVWMTNKQQRSDTQQLIKGMIEHGVTIADMPTALGLLFLQEKWPKQYHPPIIKIGGEKVTALPHYDNRLQVYNMYGPTETTIDTTVYHLSPGQTDPIPIGKPFDNTQCYVLDKYLKPVAIGIVGELYIAGAGVALGYFNQSELTAKRFIDNPFITGTKMYKTGDLVKWNEEGDLIYIERNDFQVKINGYRIELGEINAVLSQHTDIEQCHVDVLVTPTNKQIVAYYVSDKKLHSDDLKQFMQQQLPSYMIPSFYISLSSLPVNTNGKIDSKALPKPDLKLLSSQYRAPNNEFERQLTEIFQQVLALEKVGVDDHFFKLGGHSILVLKVCALIRKNLQLECEVKYLFEAPTVAQLAERLQRNQQTAITIPVASRQQNLALSFAQQRLWFIDRFEGSNHNYNIPLLFQFSNIDVECLTTALQKVIVRHEILRTIYDEDNNGHGIQVILNKTIDIDTLTIDAKALPEQIKQFSQHKFDLTQELPIKACYYQVAEYHYAALLIHHIAADGWSIDVLLRDWQAYYQHLSSDEPLSLAPLNIQYADFALWQSHYLTGELLDKQLAFWQQQLKNFEPLNIFTDKPRPKTVSYHGANVNFELDETLSQALQQLCEKADCTLYTVLLAGFYLLLQRYSEQHDIIIGSPVAGRHYPDIDQLIGFFVNSLVLRHTIANDVDVFTFIKQVKNTVLQAQQHQDMPFERLVAELAIDQDTSRHPLFQVSFSLQDHTNDTLSFGNGKLRTIDIDDYYSVAKFDLTLLLTQQQHKIKGMFNYATGLFEQDTITTLSHHYRQLLQAMVTQPQKSISQLSMLNQQDYHFIIEKFNQTEVPFDINNHVIKQFEQQVKLYPKQIALEFETQQLTYQQLNQRANQFARAIQQFYQDCYQQPLTTNTLIAIHLPSRLELLIAILAVLKTGAAYVPLDPNYPQQRLDFIFEDSQAKLAIVDESTTEQNQHDHAFNIDKIQLDNYSSSNLDIAIHPQQLAYVIYTSGSTGKPKGVLLSHLGLSNLIINFQKLMALDKTARVLQFASINFDASVAEWTPALTSGATLVLLNAEERPPHQDISKLLAQKKITHATLPPAVLKTAERIDLPNLKCLITAGEACDVDTVNYWAAQTRYINAYGPTEATVGVSYQHCLPQQRITIGHPMSNIKFYVLDTEQQPVAINAPGELCISGPCLALGYLNRDELTQEKFIANPFTEQTHYQRIYRTGDLVRRLANGEIEFLGRIDDQVKLRGFRVELGEIEQMLRQYSDINDACVTVYKQGQEKQLVAFYIAEQELDHTVIKQFLSHVLSDYMIPTFYQKIDDIPLSPTGKVDRKRLPKLDLTRHQAEYFPPRNRLEQQLCDIWQDVLHLDRVSIHDDYFALGGNSINSIKLLSKINQTLKIKIILKDFFNHPSIAALARHIAGGVDSYLETLIQEDINSLDQYLSQTVGPLQRPIKNVLLTGANGFIGIYLLAELLKNANYNVTCLVRANSSMLAKQKIEHAAKEFQLGIDMQRINIILGDLSYTQLGLSLVEWEKLSNSIDLIIHNGAYVHHLAAYTSMRAANVDSVLNLIALASQKQNKRLCFISTSSACIPEDNHYPEAVNQNTVNTMLNYLTNGYVQTKWVAEQLIDAACQRGLDAIVLRLGNVTGDSHSGMSNYHDNHTLALIKSCLQLKVSINFPAEVEMMPVDFLAKAILHLASQDNTNHCFNLNNHHHISFNQCLTLFAQQLNITLQSITLSQWQKLLRHCESDNALYRFKQDYIETNLDTIDEFNNTIDTALAEQQITSADLFDYPSDYQKLIALYTDFLIKAGFLVSQQQDDSVLVS